MTAEVAAGWSALVAAVATVFGAIALVLFFSRGQPWGTINDAASVVLMVAMVVAAGLQALLVLGRVTYEQTKGGVLLAGGFVGVWYLLVAFLADGSAIEGLLAALAIASGVGFVAIGNGFAVGNERHPLSVLGGIVLLVASTAFLTILGTRLVTGDLAIPTWNA